MALLHPHTATQRERQNFQPNVTLYIKQPEMLITVKQEPTPAQHQHVYIVS